MLLLIWNDLRRMLATKWIALILLVFSYACGTSLSLAKAYMMTSLEFGLYILSNHYYLLYFFLISYLALILRNIKQLQPHELIRFRKKENFMLIKTMSVVAFTATLVFMQWLIAMIVGIVNLPTKFAFSAIPQRGIDSDTIMFFFKFKETFSSPFWAILAVCLYLIIGLSTLAMIIWAVSMKYRAKTAVITVVAIVVNIIVGFKTELSEIAYPLFINKYLLFHHVQFHHGWFAVGLLLLIQGVIIGLLVTKRKRFNKRTHLFDRFLNNKRNYSIVLVFLLFFFFLRLISFKAGGTDSSWLDFLTSLYVGIPQNEVSLKEFLSYIIYMGVPIYFIGKFEEFASSYQSAPWMIRHKNKQESNYGILRTEAKFIILYFLAGLVISILISLTVRGEFSGELLEQLGISNQDLIVLLTVSQLFRLLELFMILGLFRFFMKHTGQSTLAFILSMFGYLVLFFSVNLSKYYPFGLSSIIRLINLYSHGIKGIFAIFIIFGILVMSLHAINLNKIGGRILWKK